MGKRRYICSPKQSTMLQQYTANIEKFGTAYAFLEATQTGQMVRIEYYLITDDSGNATIKGGILEAEALMEQTLEAYLNEHIKETLPYMVIRFLVDNHAPEELDDLAEVVFAANSHAASTVKQCYPHLAKLIAEKCTSEDIRVAFV